MNFFCIPHFLEPPKRNLKGRKLNFNFLCLFSNPFAFHRILFPTECQASVKQAPPLRAGDHVSSQRRMGPAYIYCHLIAFRMTLRGWTRTKDGGKVDPDGAPLVAAFCIEWVMYVHS